MEENKKVQQINIELDEKVSGGEYANFVVVTHSPAEVVMDFTRLLPGVAKAKVHSRIINIKKFESKYGEIKTPGQEGFTEFGVKPPEDVLPN
jgi:hypothetical protein